MKLTGHVAVAAGVRRDAEADVVTLVPPALVAQSRVPSRAYFATNTSCVARSAEHGLVGFARPECRRA